MDERDDREDGQIDSLFCAKQVGRRGIILHRCEPPQEEPVGCRRPFLSELQSYEFRARNPTKEEQFIVYWNSDAHFRAPEGGCRLDVA